MINLFCDRAEVISCPAVYSVYDHQFFFLWTSAFCGDSFQHGAAGLSVLVLGIYNLGWARVRRRRRRRPRRRRRSLCARGHSVVSRLLCLGWLVSSLLTSHAVVLSRRSLRSLELRFGIGGAQRRTWAAGSGAAFPKTKGSKLQDRTRCQGFGVQLEKFKPAAM